VVIYTALFIDFLKFQITSRREFERLVKIDPTTLTDLERAARFIYLQKTAFGGKVRAQTFGVEKDKPARFNAMRMEAILESVYERLAGVIIENLPWQNLIERYDREGMLFYLDPPYWGCEKDYGKNIFSRDDFKRLADTLSQIKGRFILEVYETFSAFDIEEVDCAYYVGSKNNKPVKEVIITSPH